MLMRSDPFRGLDALLAQQVAGTAARPAQMPIDAYQSGEAFLVQFDLPGVSADAIELTVEQNVLTVRATRQRPAAENVEMIASERPCGTFSRQLFLGETLDTDHIDANYSDGVLTLRIPVSERAKPRKVTISSDSRGPVPVSA
jgi:HSP20 family protein